jgi:solute carrier family 25 carnitine/acylcarnitine transporter 20/29
MPSSTASPPATPDIPLAAEVKKDVAAAAAGTKNATLAQLRSFAAGGVGGICAVVVGHPFDLVKVRLQTAEKGVYSGAMDVVRKTIAREGLARVGSPVSCSFSAYFHILTPF